MFTYVKLVCANQLAAWIKSSQGLGNKGIQLNSFHKQIQGQCSSVHLSKKLSKIQHELLLGGNFQVDRIQVLVEIGLGGTGCPTSWSNCS